MVEEVLWFCQWWWPPSQVKFFTTITVFMNVDSDAYTRFSETVSYHALERREACKGGKEATKRAAAATQQSGKGSSSVAPRPSSSNGTRRHDPPSSNTGNHHSSKAPSSLNKWLLLMMKRYVSPSLSTRLVRKLISKSFENFTNSLWLSHRSQNWNSTSTVWKKRETSTSLN